MRNSNRKHLLPLRHSSQLVECVRNCLISRLDHAALVSAVKARCRKALVENVVRVKDVEKEFLNQLKEFVRATFLRKELTSFDKVEPIRRSCDLRSLLLNISKTGSERLKNLASTLSEIEVGCARD